MRDKLLECKLQHHDITWYQCTNLDLRWSDPIWLPVEVLQGGGYHEYALQHIESSGNMRLKGRHINYQVQRDDNALFGLRAVRAMLSGMKLAKSLGCCITEHLADCELFITRLHDLKNKPCKCTCCLLPKHATTYYKRIFVPSKSWQTIQHCLSGDLK